MSSSLSLHRARQWFAVLCLAVVALVGVGVPRSAFADEPTPDPTGAYQTTPTGASIAGYTKLDPEKATTKELAAALDAVAQSSSRSFFSINFMWVLIAGFLVIFMQAGFALVETGLIRGKNAAETFSMNFAVYALGMFGFFLTGAAYDSAAIVLFLFMMAFMDTTATIVTGACAERWTYKHFCIYSIIIGAFIYPVFGCWVWGGGWLAQLGYRSGFGHGAVDFAGSGVVHLQGGALALITAILIGPRIGKYNKDGSANAILPHDIPMVQLGTFILAFGWFGFNAGSSLAGTDG